MALFAAEQGHNVLAGPDLSLDPRTYGTGRPIRDGAILVVPIDHILKALPTYWHAVNYPYPA